MLSLTVVWAFAEQHGQVMMRTWALEPLDLGSSVVCAAPWPGAFCKVCILVEVSVPVCDSRQTTPDLVRWLGVDEAQRDIALC